jgi:hypothetical protein
MPESGGRQTERKFWIALLLYGVLAVLVWCTLGRGTILAFGRPVELRLIPLTVLGLFAFRTWVAREAEKIRRQDSIRGLEREGGSDESRRPSEI